jgi:mono/diheme cytochrome c family protein
MEMADKPFGNKVLPPFQLADQKRRNDALAKIARCLMSFALGCAAYTGSPASFAQTAATNPVLAGKLLFNANCAACHQKSGAGGVHFGNSVSADLRAPGLEAIYRGSDALILRAILQAKDETGAPLNSPMPAWAGRLSTQQAAAIIAYLHTLKAS